MTELLEQLYDRHVDVRPYATLSAVKARLAMVGRKLRRARLRGQDCQQLKTERVLLFSKLLALHHGGRLLPLLRDTALQSNRAHTMLLLCLQAVTPMAPVVPTVAI